MARDTQALDDAAAKVVDCIESIDECMDTLKRGRRDLQKWGADDRSLYSDFDRVDNDLRAALSFLDSIFDSLRP